MLDKPNLSDTELASLSSDILLERFKTGIHGLTEKEVKSRLEIFGPNQPANSKKHHPVILFFSKFLSPLIMIMLVITFISLAMGEEMSAIMVFIMLMVSVILDFIQEYKSGKAAEKLSQMVKTTVAVFRNSKLKEVNIKEIVPGEIVYLSAGAIIPGDLRLISSKDLFINQAALTGESFPVEKQHGPIKPQSDSILHMGNLAYMGTSVVSGTGTGLILRTGTDTKFGEISKSLTQSKVETSFDKGIKDYTWLMIRFTVTLAVAIFLINVVFKPDISYVQALLFSLAVAVGLTPEMLPMLVTVNLSKGAISMSKKQVIVKKLSSIQNFGAMDVLCTDKTGTLTLGEVILQKHCNVKGKEDEDVLREAYINSHYQTGLRNLLDKAILRHEHIQVDSYKKIDEIPFDFSRRMMSVAIENGKKQRLITKGAPLAVFNVCSRYELDGKVYPVKKILAPLKEEFKKLGEEGFRVVAVAYREFRGRKSFTKEDEKDMILKGYVAFLDPPKSTAKKTIHDLRELGVNIKVLTGDNEYVTKKICTDVGIDVVGLTTGDIIEKLDDKELGELVKTSSVFARLSPLQKERVVRAIRINGHTVGFLGDGINDGPALKAADVGISVNNAVDIAKEAAGIILLKKSLIVLKEGVIEGRKTFGNIVKYLRMGSSSNFGNMFSLTGASIFLPFLPMLPIQILLNNFLYDLSQVAIPTDNVDPEYVKKPRTWNIDGIKKFMMVFGPVSSIFDFIAFGVLLFIFRAQEHVFQTGWFWVSLITQVLVIHIIRTSKLPFIESRPSRFLVLTSVIVILAALVVPFSAFGEYFLFDIPPAGFFLALSLIVVGYTVSAEYAKRWFIKRYRYD
jgi:P-type Mg2+ transporter